MAPKETNLEWRAKDFAHRAHAGQLRKYTKEPYIVHPAAVVELVRSVPHTETMLCAAWLHDVVEDCGMPVLELERIFGYDVACLVVELTDVSAPSDGNRAARKARDRAHLVAASPAAKTIKLADLIDNSRNIMERDRKFAAIYLPEKRLLLDEALREGDPALWATADKIVREGLNS